MGTTLRGRCGWKKCQAEMGQNRSRSWAVRYSKGDVTAGGFYMGGKPSAWKPDGTAYGAMYAPALSVGAYNLSGWFMYAMLAKLGVHVAATDCGDTPSTSILAGGTGTTGPGLWVQVQAKKKFKDLFNAQTGAKVGAPSDKMIVMGESRGAALACNWALDTPTKVLCI